MKHSDNKLDICDSSHCSGKDKEFDTNSSPVDDAGERNNQIIGRPMDEQRESKNCDGCMNGKPKGPKCKARLIFVPVQYQVDAAQK